MTHKIFAGPADYGNAKPLLGEAVANVDVVTNNILPGNAVTFVAGALGTKPTAKLSDEAATVVAEPKIAVEQGSHLGATIDTPIATADELVTYVKVRSGEFVYVRAAAATLIGNDAPIGLDGTGKFSNVLEDGTQHVMFRSAAEATGAVANDDDLILVYRP